MILSPTATRRTPAPAHGVAPGRNVRREQTPFKFRLYVAGDAFNSSLALVNLTALCRAYLPHRHAIEIVDVLRHPQRALSERIFLTPTLVRLAPLPAVRIVGTLSNIEVVLRALGLEPIAA